MPKRCSPTKAATKLKNISDPVPDAWDAQLDGGFAPFEYARRASTYALVYPESKFAPGPALLDSADLQNPRVRRLPAGETVGVVVGDSTADPLIQGEYDSQVPGVTVDDPSTVKVSVQKLDGSGSVTSVVNTTVDTKVTSGTLDPSSMRYAELSLQAGYYRILPVVDGTAGTPVYVQVGSPRAIINPQQRLADFKQSAEQKLAQQAEAIEDLKNKGTVKQYNATTNSNGIATLSVDQSVKTIHVQAVKSPDFNVSTQNVSYRNLSEGYGNGSTKASLVLPSQTKRVDVPPGRNVTLTVTEVPYPDFASVTGFQNLSDFREALLENVSLSDLPAGLQQRLNNTSRERLETVYSRLENLTQKNDRLRDRYLRLLNKTNSSTDSIEDLRARLNESKAVSDC